MGNKSYNVLGIDNNSKIYPLNNIQIVEYDGAGGDDNRTDIKFLDENNDPQTIYERYLQKSGDDNTLLTNLKGLVIGKSISSDIPESLLINTTNDSNTFLKIVDDTDTEIFTITKDSSDVISFNHETNNILNIYSDRIQLNSASKLLFERSSGNIWFESSGNSLFLNSESEQIFEINATHNYFSLSNIGTTANSGYLNGNNFGVTDLIHYHQTHHINSCGLVEPRQICTIYEFDVPMGFMGNIMLYVESNVYGQMNSPDGIEFRIEKYNQYVTGNRELIFSDTNYYDSDTIDTLKFINGHYFHPAKYRMFLEHIDGCNLPHKLHTCLKIGVFAGIGNINGDSIRDFTINRRYWCRSYHYLQDYVDDQGDW